MLGIDVSRTVNELINALSVAMDIDEDVKLYHGCRVAIAVAALGTEFDGEERKGLFYSALLHDIGGVGLANHIVHYAIPGKEIPEPGVIAHPLISAEIIAEIPPLADMAAAILDHHEKWNGHGYPRGKQGEEINPGGHLICVADFLDLHMRLPEAPKLEKTLAAIDARRQSAFRSEVVDRAADALRQGLFEQMADVEHLPNTFEAAAERVGPVQVEPGTDAIGVALEVFAQVIDTKHPYTIGHTKRVTRYTLLIGIAMGLPHDEITKLKWAALLHDVGKLSVPRRVLDKPSKLSSEEYAALKRHAKYTFDIVSMITDFRDIAPIAAGHHERFDGKGYPFGLRGEDIPLGARILSVADAFDAMTSNRPYRCNNSIADACEELKRGAGTQFDPNAVKEALSVLSNLGIAIQSTQ